MKKNEERLDHAIHNEAVCQYLALNHQFSDWIITTAFYSALQFVAYKIFPFEAPAMAGKKTTINSIDELHGYSNPKKISKHELLADLVEKYCPSISADYDWLKDMSMIARYTNYQHDKPISDKAMRLLGIIKSHCTK